MNTQKLTEFLKDLENHNNKEWFEQHREEYDQLRQDFTDLVQSVIEQSAKFDHSLTGLEAKSTLFRINRDIRFSHDKTPYKTYFSAMLTGGSKKELHAGYYFHIGAGGELIIGAGAHGFTPPDLKRARHYILENHESLTKILKKAKEEGLSDLEGEKLVSVPHGFPADHPAGEYLKYKSFTIVHKEKVSTIKEDLASHIVKLLKATHPFEAFMDKAIKT